MACRAQAVEDNSDDLDSTLTLPPLQSSRKLRKPTVPLPENANFHAASVIPMHPDLSSRTLPSVRLKSDTRPFTSNFSPRPFSSGDPTVKPKRAFQAPTWRPRTWDYGDQYAWKMVDIYNCKLKKLRPPEQNGAPEERRPQMKAAVPALPAVPQLRASGPQGVASILHSDATRPLSESLLVTPV